uniref:Uncharacterized protein n=1 Tax=Strongyloides papillosus TaxID=174720 RepID=A0A0N5C1C9_STREA
MDDTTNEKKDDTNFNSCMELKRLVEESNTIRSNFASLMKEFHERGEFEKLEKVYYTKIAEMRLCSDELDDLVNSLSQYCKTFNDVTTICTKIKQKLDNKKKLPDFADFI